jgi:hypothetical protein
MHLEAEIKKLEAELQQVRAAHHPSVTANLQKERAYLAIEIQRTQKAVQLTDQQCVNERRRLAEIEISPRYQTVLDLETKVLELKSKYQFLRGIVTNYKKEFDATKMEPLAKSQEAKLEREASLSLIKMKYSLTRADERTKRKPGKWQEQINRLLLEIEDLNERIIDLTMSEEHIVDLDALRGTKSNEEPEKVDLGTGDDVHLGDPLAAVMIRLAMSLG